MSNVPFNALTRFQIRDALLGYWQARYLAATGTPLQIQPGSPAYLEADGVGVLCEPIQARAASVANNIFPDTADPDALLHHGAIDGIAKKPATAAVERIQINGTAAQTVTYGTSTIQGSNGLTYTASTNPDGTGTSVVLDGSGHATIYATCVTLGTVGNLTSGTMTWSALPANATSVITILGVQVTAADIESDPVYANRIVRNRQARPGSGNRADAEAWMEAVSNVAEGYVYPLLQPSTTSGVLLGCWVGVPIGFAPSTPTALTPSRVLVVGDKNNIAGYIEGTNDAQGRASTDPTHGPIQQLRPATTAVGDYAIQLPTTTGQDVQLHITLSGLTFPFSGTFTTAAACTTTLIKLTADPTGIIHDGDLVAIPDSTPSGAARGGYLLRNVVNGSVTASQFSVTPALPTLPNAALVVYPAPSNWAAMRDAILSIFDRLGPGDTSPATRWPPETVIGPATLYLSALAAAVMGVPGLPGALPGVTGVLSATVATPGANTTAAPLQLLREGKITFIP